MICFMVWLICWHRWDWEYNDGKIVDLVMWVSGLIMSDWNSVEVVLTELCVWDLTEVVLVYTSTQLHTIQVVTIIDSCSFISNINQCKCHWFEEEKLIPFLSPASEVKKIIFTSYNHHTLFSKRSAHESHPNFLRSLGHWPQPRILANCGMGSFAYCCQDHLTKLMWP